MIVTLENNDGYIYAYAEFEVVDGNTVICDEGKYVYVQNIWIHEDYRGNGVLKDLMVDIFIKSKNAEFVYWNRSRYNRVSGLHCISKVLRHTKLKEAVS